MANAFLKIRDIVIDVEIADTLRKKSRGLSGRESFASGHGMLFPFRFSGFHPFWMKDMKFSIDIIWIGKDRKVVDITKNAVPKSFPRPFVSRRPARYALEINAGLAARCGIAIGDEVRFLL